MTEIELLTGIYNQTTDIKLFLQFIVVCIVLTGLYKLFNIFF